MVKRISTQSEEAFDRRDYEKRKEKTRVHPSIKQTSDYKGERNSLPFSNCVNWNERRVKFHSEACLFFSSILYLSCFRKFFELSNTSYFIESRCKIGSFKLSSFFLFFIFFTKNFENAACKINTRGSTGFRFHINSRRLLFPPHLLFPPRHVYPLWPCGFRTVLQKRRERGEKKRKKNRRKKERDRKNERDSWSSWGHST